MYVKGTKISGGKTMQHDASQRAEHEAAYRRGWQQGVTEVTFILLQLVELNASNKELRNRHSQE
jgi:hypothetical protein